jgi:hypothetical protein
MLLKSFASALLLGIVLSMSPAEAVPMTMALKSLHDGGNVGFKSDAANAGPILIKNRRHWSERRRGRKASRKFRAGCDPWDPRGC